MCLWMDLRSPADLEPLRSGAPASITRPVQAPPGAIRMLSVSTTLSAPEFTAMETSCSSMASPATEALSLQGSRLLSRVLPAIQANPRPISSAAQVREILELDW